MSNLYSILSVEDHSLYRHTLPPDVAEAVTHLGTPRDPSDPKPFHGSHSPKDRDTSGLEVVHVEGKIDKIYDPRILFKRW